MQGITAAHVHANAQAMCSLEPGNYYVSATDAGRFALVAGPYLTHRAALKDMQRVQGIADQATQGRSVFYFWGTCRMEHNHPGVLNRAGLL